MRRLLVLAPLLALALAPEVAEAHVGLVSPVPREGRERIKNPPCGRTGSVRSENVSVFAPGETIEVVFDEFVEHPGHYRIAFDEDGDDDFAEPICLENCARGPDPVFAEDTTGTVLVDRIPDRPDGGEYRVSVTLPDVECERCTLQLIQVMYDKRSYEVGGDDTYFQCAYLALRRPPGSDAGPEADAGATADAGADAGAADDAGALREDAGGAARDAGAEPDGGGGCATTGSPAGTGLAGLALVLWAARRRRRPRA